MKNSIVLSGFLLSMSPVAPLVGMELETFRGSIIPLYKAREHISNIKIDKDYDELIAGNGGFLLKASKLCMMEEEMLRVIFNADGNDLENKFKERKDCFVLQLQGKREAKNYLVKHFAYYDALKGHDVSQKYARRCIEKMSENRPACFVNECENYDINSQSISLKHQKPYFDREAGESSSKDATSQVLIDTAEYERLKTIKKPIYLLVTNFAKNRYSEWFALHPKADNTVEQEQAVAKNESTVDSIPVPVSSSNSSDKNIGILCSVQ